MGVYFSKLEVPLLRAAETVEFALKVMVNTPLPLAMRSEVHFSYVPSRQSELYDEWSGCVLLAEAAIHKTVWQLQDLFMEVPDNAMGALTLPIARQMWLELWGRKDAAVAESVKLVAKPRAKVEQFIQKCLRRYVVLASGASVKCLIFLPPQYHLLLDVKLGAQSTRFKIKTDLYPVMAFVEDFLSF